MHVAEDSSFFSWSTSGFSSWPFLPRCFYISQSLADLKSWRSCLVTWLLPGRPVIGRHWTLTFVRGKNSQIFRERNSGVNESGPGPFYVMGSTLYTFVQDNLSFNLVLTNVHAQNKHKHVHWQSILGEPSKLIFGKSWEFGPFFWWLVIFMCFLVIFGGFFGDFLVFFWLGLGTPRHIATKSQHLWAVPRQIKFW